MTPIVELRAIKLQFDARPIFTHLNWSLTKEATYVLVGPSGHGKSVLLKMMGGILPPDSGSVLIDGQDLYQANLSERQQILMRLCMLFQKNALIDSITDLENEEIPMRETTNQSTKEIRSYAMHLLTEVGLDHVTFNYPSQISGGMQKRLGVARALALKPEIIFYDDPTAGLDPITSRKIIDLIINLKKEHRSTVVAITNDMNRAIQLADEIFMVVDGELVKAGSPDKIFSHPDPRVQQFIRGEVNGPLTKDFS